MARYENTNSKVNKIKRGVEDKTHYKINANKTTLYNTIPFSNNDVYVITQEGDRLDLLSNEYYGDSRFWWYIAKANGLNFMTLNPGTKLRIPATTAFATGK